MDRSPPLGTDSISSIAATYSRHLISLKHLVESPHNVRVKGIRPFGICGTITPMFIHPKPGRWIFPDHRFEAVPAGLRHLLMIHLRPDLKFLVQDHAPTAVW